LNKDRELKKTCALQLCNPRGPPTGILFLIRI
jgi:hypothetical protein